MKRIQEIAKELYKEDLKNLTYAAAQVCTSIHRNEIEDRRNNIYKEIERAIIYLANKTH